MKKILAILFIFMAFVSFTGCSNTGLKKIDFKTLENKLNDKESFILEIVQTGCTACEDFTPRFSKILKDNKIKAFSLNISDITDAEYSKLNDWFNISGTPNVIFITKGEEESQLYRISGNVEDSKIISKLKSNGYIK